LPKVDRNNEWLAAWSLKPNGTKLAALMKAAICDGAVFSHVTLEKDIDKKSYYQVEYRDGVYLHRTINAQLKQIGY